MKRMLVFLLVPFAFAASLGTALPQEAKFNGKSMKDWAAAARDPNPSVRIKATFSLYSVVGAVGPKNAMTLVPALIELLKDDDESVRRYAAWSLGKFGPLGKTAVPDLTAALDDTEALVRANACEALGNIGAESKGAVPTFTKLLQDPDWFVRRAAAVSLGQMGAAAKPAVGALHTATKDPQMEVRQAAIISLGQLGANAPESWNVVTEAFKDKDWNVRRAALQVIIAFKVDAKEIKKLVAELAEALDDENTLVVDAAAGTLGYVCPSAPNSVLALFESPKANVRYHAAYVFGLAEGKLAKLGVPGLSKLLKDPDERVKSRAIASLGAIGADSRNALPALRELMLDANPRIQRRAQEAVRLIEAKAK